jgi:hypothetical protein
MAKIQSGNRGHSVTDVSTIVDALIQIRDEIRLLRNVLKIFNQGTNTSSKLTPNSIIDNCKASTIPKSGEWLKEITLTLTSDPVQNDVKTRFGSAKVANFNALSEYGVLRVSLWDNNAISIMGFGVGDKIRLTNMQVKDSYEGLIQISGCRNTKITLVA